MSVHVHFQRITGLDWPHNERSFAQQCSKLVNQREAMQAKITSTRKKIAQPLQHEDHLKHPQNISFPKHSHWIDRLDSVLCQPEQFKYRGMRYIVHAAKHAEEMGETIADLSGMIERLVQNVLSPGKASNTAQILGAGAGRATTMTLTFPGFAVHKALGAGLYALSCGLSAVALLAANTPLGAKRSVEKHQQALKESRFAHSVVRDTSRLLLTGREKTMRALYNKAGNRQGSELLKSVAKRLSRTMGAYGPEAHHLHQHDTDYIWGHLHQYGPITRALMSSAHLVYTVVNRLGASFDKYLGSSIGRMVFKPMAGRILGHRLGMLVSTCLATYISMLLAPFIVGISATGAMACGLTLLLMQAAKLSSYLEGWKGDILPYHQGTTFWAT